MTYPKCQHLSKSIFIFHQLPTERGEWWCGVAGVLVRVACTVLLSCFSCRVPHLDSLAKGFPNMNHLRLYSSFLLFFKESKMMITHLYSIVGLEVLWKIILPFFKLWFMESKFVSYKCLNNTVYKLSIYRLGLQNRMCDSSDIKWQIFMWLLLGECGLHTTLQIKPPTCMLQPTSGGMFLVMGVLFG